jgi:predicted CoA-binding protein
MDPKITEFIQQKKLALVGASRDGKSFGNYASKELKQRGYEVLLVHPQAKEIDGQACYPDLQAVQDQVGGVVVCVPAAQAEGVLNQAGALGMKRVWLQQGAQTSQLVALGEQLGLEMVSGKCILMYAEPVGSIHKWHRGFMKLIGKL